jgi:hypothetical protein
LIPALPVLLAVLAAGAAPQRSTYSGGSTSRIASPAVVASWTSHENYADGSTTTLLVLWRGTPGWFTKGGYAGGGSGGGSGAGAGSGQSGSYAYQYMTQGGLTFMLEFDYDKRTVRILNEVLSLRDVNVVLVDFVDSAGGAAIVGWRWIEPGPPAPPIVPGAAADPVAGVIRRSPELFDYLRCDLRVPQAAMNAMVSMVCGLMRPPSP